MSIAGIAGNLDTTAIGIGTFSYSARDLLVKAWPATARMKFGIGIIERCFTAAAEVGAFDKKIIILASEWAFGALVHDDRGFLWGELIHSPYTYTRDAFCDPGGVRTRDR